MTTDKTESIKLPDILKHYKEADFNIKLRVRFIWFVLQAIFVVIMLAIANSAFFQISESILNLEIFIAEFSILLLILFGMYLLKIGQYQYTPYFIVIVPTSIIWVIMWVDKANALSRLDTIMFLFPVLNMFLLFLNKKRVYIHIFMIVNICLFAIFLINQGSALKVSSHEAIDFFVNFSMAFIFMAATIYQILLLNRRIIETTENEIVQRKLAEETLKESEEKYRSLLESTFEGIYLINGQQFEYVNEQFSRITGYSKEELMSKGSEIFQLTPIDIVKRDISKENHIIFESKFITKTGQSIDLEISTTSLGGSGDSERYIGVVRDITEKNRIDALEKEVSLAREKVDFKQKFLASMSHEIRTPLTGVLGMADVLAKTALSTEQRQHLNTLIQSGENLREIINLILDYSKLEAGKVKLKRKNFAFETLLKETESLFASICNKDIILQIEKSPNLPKYINTDKQRLSQILRNLVSNAVKFTDSGSVHIKALVAMPDLNRNEILAEDELMLMFKITDTGLGISEESQKKLFIPFSQIDQGHISQEGTGLGLSICKELCNLLGGDIGVKSIPGQGSTFWFTFKVRLVHTSEETTSISNNTMGLKPLSILLVEDKMVNQKVIGIMLSSLGHKVSFANNGEHALEVYQPDVFDLILMDIQMPVMDGITATLKLREKYLKLPPIVGLSANAFEGDRERYMRLGVDEYLTKPLDIAEFERLISMLI